MALARWLALLLFPFGPVAGADLVQSNVVRIVDWKGTVEVLRAGAAFWDPASTRPPYDRLFPGDQLRTRARSRVTLQLPDNTTEYLDAFSQIEIEAPSALTERLRLRLGPGRFYFFHRGRPGRLQMRIPSTPPVVAGVVGTEFHVVVSEDGRAEFNVFDGRVDLSNELGGVVVTNGQRGVVAPGVAPTGSPMLMAMEQLIQWCLYYPAVLHVDELDWAADERESVLASIRAYQLGDWHGAFGAYPWEKPGISSAGRVYRAALQLLGGQTEDASADLTFVAQDALASDRTKALGNALGRLIAAVRRQAGLPALPGGLASAALADSYYEQAQGRLLEARQRARDAVKLAPSFGFAQIRLAELEFSFGHWRLAERALEVARTACPSHAYAETLRGYVLAAKGDHRAADAAFGVALAGDGGLAPAWLGRGLMKIRRGHIDEGLADLEMAAALEPQRGVFRSYLAKGYLESGAPARAWAELDRAKLLDPGDPTVWLYAALAAQRENRLIEAVQNLEESQALNRNRALFRSSLRLDQDAAVRGANLAGIYADAGLEEVAAREAAQAVNVDYAGYAGHNFLANAYQQRRDSRGVNLRYETAWQTEYLLANLLSPAAVETLASEVGYQEYSRLFERNRWGIRSRTQYASEGDWLQSAMLLGQTTDGAYVAEGFFQSRNGDRPNRDSEQWAGTAKVKQRITDRDHLFLQATAAELSGGDLASYYRDTEPDPLNPGQRQTNYAAGLRFRDTLEPLVLAGWHREWSPASHTLLLGAWWRSQLEMTDPASPVLFFGRFNPTNSSFTSVSYPRFPTADMDYQRDFNGGSLEAQQIWQWGEHSVVAGGRFQGGDLDAADSLGPSTGARLSNGTSVSPNFVTPALTNQLDSSFHRWALYAYHSWQIRDSWLVTAGLTYDWLEYPRSFQRAPVSEGQRNAGRFSPKVGTLWTPQTDTAIRTAYGQSLGGVSFEQSFRLEPGQVAGINQAYRSLIPESVVGIVSAARLETAGLAWDQKWGSGTYAGLQLDWSRSRGQRELSTIELFSVQPVSYETGRSSERLDYVEKGIAASVHQFWGDRFTTGLRYRASRARLESHLLRLPTSISPLGRSDVAGTLHRLELSGLYLHPSGFFAGAEGIWSVQSLQGFAGDPAGDNFWQGNLHGGYRFPGRRWELQLALLNVTDQSYRLHPLNLTSELPRDRTLVASLRLNF